MRRVVFLCLILLLPLQAVWSAAATIGLKERPCLMAMQASAQQHAQGGDATDGGAMPQSPCCGSDCSSSDVDCPLCDHLGVVGMISVPVVLADDRPGGSYVATARAGLPDHIPERPLRPPSAPAA